MNYSFKKGDIRRSIMFESGNYKVFKKGNLTLREDVNNNGYTTYTTTPEKTASAVDSNPNGSAIIPKNNTDSNNSDNEITIKQTVQNGSQVEKAVNDLNQNPEIKKLDSDKVNYEFDKTTKESRDSVRLSKRELFEMLKK